MKALVISICFLLGGCIHIPPPYPYEPGHPHHGHKGPSHSHKHHGHKSSTPHEHPIAVQWRFQLKDKE